MEKNKTETTEKKKTRRKKKIDKTLEDTTRIRIDDVRINDAESLDVSFIEGRKNKKVRENNKAKENILKEKKDFSFIFSVIKILFILIVLGVIIFLGAMAIKETNIFKDTDKKETKEEKKTEKVKLSDNYLFVGDFYIDNMNFDEFIYSYVKSGNKDYTTSDLLDNLNNDIYVYNPSSVFIEIGYNDLINEVEENTILNNIEDIIKGIKSNREYAKIYIESLYPINSKDSKIDNDTIKNFNERLEKLVKSLEVNYIDMYSELVEDDLLKESYTDDGILLNEDGYKRVFKVINKIVDEEHEKE